MLKTIVFGFLFFISSCGWLVKAPHEVSQRTGAGEVLSSNNSNNENTPAPTNPKLALCSSAADKKIPLRKAFSALTYQEYINTVNAIFGINAQALNLTLAENRLPGSKFLSVSAETQTLNDQQIQRYFYSAEMIANHLADNPALLAKANCALNSANCYKQTIDAYFPLLFRRPLTEEEKNAFYALANQGAANAWRIAATAALTSPSFIYLAEMGEAEGSERRLSAAEFKTRLSLMFFRSAYHPDIEALSEAQYEDKKQLQAFIAALLEKPAVKTNFEQMFAEWLRTDKIQTLSRDPSDSVSFTDSMKSSFAEEIRLLVQDYAWTQSSFGDILNSKYSFVNADISDIYGVTGSSAFKKTSLPADRSGLLTTPGVLTLGSKANHTSIVHRGLYVLEVLTCTSIPPPPGDVNVNITVEEDGNVANAEEAHSKNPQCAGCHLRIDPLGKGLENFDQLGLFRTKYHNGESIAGLGKFEGKEFSSAPELTKILSDNKSFVSCARQKAVEWMLRERNAVASFCLDESLVPDAATYNVKDFLSRYLVSDSFLKFRFSQ